SSPAVSTVSAGRPTTRQMNKYRPPSINLHLLTGQIGKPGAGPFSLTGQPNAMGGREVGLLAQALPGYRFTEDPGHPAEAEAFWGRPAATVSTTPGLTAVEMSRALEATGGPQILPLLPRPPEARRRTRSTVGVRRGGA